MKNKLVDEMVFDTKNDRWIFIIFGIKYQK